MNISYYVTRYGVRSSYSARSTACERQTVSVTSYVENTIRPSHYEGGTVEHAQESANRAIEALSRLCEILADKGVLDVNEITRIAGSEHIFNEEKPELTP